MRFGAAKTPVQEATYDRLYPVLVRLRDEFNTRGPSPLSAQESERDPKALSEFFSGIDDSHLQPQPKPTSSDVPPPPRPR